QLSTGREWCEDAPTYSQRPGSSFIDPPQLATMVRGGERIGDEELDQAQPVSPPKRVLILGPSGSGKSTLARQIGERLDLPVIHLDATNWNPGWVQTERAHFRERVAEAVRGDVWVMDGNDTSDLDLRLPRAEAVIWLDLPRYVYFPRALWRSIKNYGNARDDVGPGCPERLDLCFSGIGCGPTRRAASPGMQRSWPICRQQSAGSFCDLLAKWRHSPTAFTNGLPHSLLAA